MKDHYIDIVGGVMWDARDGIAKGAAYMYRIGPRYLTGDPDKDLRPGEMDALLHAAEDMFIFVGLLPKDWESVVPGGRGHAN